MLPFCDEVELRRGDGSAALERCGARPLELGAVAAAYLEREMQIQIGRFVCTLSIGDCGEVEARWLPWQPKYLNKDERVQYRVGRAAFLECANPGSIVDVIDRLSSADPPSRGYT